jgi:RNA ligase (TIGR02306 family)
MSSLFMPVAEIRDIRPHPNADKLDIAEVLGWQVVVGRGQHHEGDKIVYVPPDTILPVELTDRIGVTQYLHKQRIQSTRLRGEPSFGLVLPVEDESWEVGQNVAEHFGAVKWEPPTRESERGQGKFIPNEHKVPRNPLFAEYTEIENMRHYPEMLGVDERVAITEKIHGTNSRIGMVDGEWLAGSHHVQRGPGDALYWSPKPVVERMVEELGKYHKQVIVFGEIYGDAVQSLSYGKKGYEGYRAFDLMIDGRYIDYLAFADVCCYYHVPRVPTLVVGRFTLEDARKLSKGTSEIYGAKHLREGVVVKPLIERTNPRVGRVILKYVSDDYLLAKKTDFKDE